MDAENIMDGLAGELESALKGMAKAKSVEDKLMYSKIVKNLSKSLGVFLELASDMMDYDADEDFDA
ncbi:MAG: hypothetical protein KKD63_04830 [Proteobacteria bacterium]|nr:hypothetical protein [Desulfobulbaceae bacterium]MBU4152186.1 hypothetical protein [Pseudomonadota bacterium]MDP2106578.1 hypothetical protein [Desulfobulbaceae bacterium]